MSRLEEFRAIERLIAVKKTRLAQIESDSRFKLDYEFEEKLHALLAEYPFGLEYIIKIAVCEGELPLDICQPGWQRPRQHAFSQGRPMKSYTNPHTLEVVEARSNRHKTLQMWIQQYGRPEVETWASLWP
ncbi:histone-like nucleoid-structuring protein, MvaT/MvaU family [Pseudomonas sp. NPDC090592]|uniref:histone-like nucleoid-structuring protein, MvaT/MvaU family n=1 Tax=Pseudomonas sp. NPDC090592 TaxID=3364480 RepID=UPI00383ACE1F